MPLIDSLFQVLIDHRGSDLHIEEGQKPKIRIQGKLTPVGQEVLNRQAMNTLLSEIALVDDWGYFETHGDLDFAYTFNREARFRANYFRHFHGLGAVFRLIPSKIRTFEELDLPPRIKDFVKWRSGL